MHVFYHAILMEIWMCNLVRQYTYPSSLLSFFPRRLKMVASIFSTMLCSSLNTLSDGNIWCL